ncbi:ATPase [Nibricoccus aquaticus]|uniref:Xylose transport system permease protein XylH n=1 Tax=Nibricoccus aquaticus TaxID=2576891 RepID=A0A290QC14_9BACT|nr:ATPase [Nibricoccus aquaticus]ATC63776.1 ATPase [Nibricoccus aquaticus]
MNARVLLKSLSMPIALALIVAFFALREPAFLGARNLTQLIIEFSIIGTLALGMFMILLTGQIDLSVGSGVGLIGGIAAVLVFHEGWSAPAAMGAGLVAALVLWALMGTLIVKQRIPSFIITLGGLLIFKGIFWKVISSATVPVSRGDEENLFSLLTTYYLPANIGLGLAFATSLVLGWLVWRAREKRIDYRLPVNSTGRETLFWVVKSAAIFGLVVVCNNFRGVPLSLLILGATGVVVYFLTKHTPFGRYLYAIGGNEEAAVLSGIAVNRVMIGAYVLMGVTVAITGFMSTAYIGSSTTTVGDLLELDAIAACVIGGTALKGGRGTVLGVLFGALIMTALLNGMGLLGVEPEIKYIARGLVLVLAVWLDVKLSRS